MKKIFFTMMAVTALTACTQDEVMEQNRTPIAFGNAFVDNASRAVDPSYSSTNKVTEFQVWGQLVGNTNNKVQLYKDVKVYSTKGNETKDYNSAWFCDQVEYWVPSATYHFGAVANGTVIEMLNLNGLPEIITYPATNVTNDGTKDLIWADEVTVNTDFNANPNAVVSTDSKLVAFTFNHLLSKLHFQFENGMGQNSKYTYKIKDIKIAGVPASGTYTVSTKQWNPANETTIINFGVASNESTEVTTENAAIINTGTSVTSNHARMIIPCNKELTVTFVKELYYNNTLVYSDASNTNESEKVTTIEFTHEFEANGAYVLKVTLKQDNKIEFTVKEVDSWDTDHNNNNQADDDVAIPTPQPAA